MDLSLAGDLLSAGSALAGLVLVFLGGVLNAYSQYDTSQQKAVRGKYRRRAWFCFAGLILAVAGSVFAFLANFCDSISWVGWSATALGASLLVLLLMAWTEVRDI